MSIIVPTIFPLMFGILIGVVIKSSPNYINGKRLLSEKDICDLTEEAYQKGKTDGLGLGFSNGKTQGFKEGETFMKNRYVTFMEEVMTMVKNDEMEIIEFIDKEE